MTNLKALCGREVHGWDATTVDDDGPSGLGQLDAGIVDDRSHEADGREDEVSIWCDQQVRNSLNLWTE